MITTKAAFRVVRYAIVVGALVVAVFYLGGLFTIDERERGLMESAVRESPEITSTIGQYESMSLLKVVRYEGTPSDPPFIKRLMRVSGTAGEALVWIRITNPDSSQETIAIENVE